MKSTIITLLFCVTSLWAVAQFAPPAGQPGSTAIHKDSSILVAWATHCTLQRGFQDISNPNSGLVSFGDSSNAVGPANAANVVSLGDGGSAILRFQTPIVNGPGFDFAVFENSFVDTFLELAFVEVSSNGTVFYRFPATSNTQDTAQVQTFGGLDATKLNNLAGKYIGNYGTPFDLDELKGIAGLNVNHITHVRIVDVVGCINDTFARYDKNNRKINDPWRTDFYTGGFDLDAVGVIHTWPTAVTSVDKHDMQLMAYPNPSLDGQINIQFLAIENAEAFIEVLSWQGRIIEKFNRSVQRGNNKLSVSLPPQTGNYLLRIQLAGHLYSTKIQVSN